MTGEAFILAHGEPPSPSFIARMAAEAALFIVADGAANNLSETVRAPDIILGDLDSLHPEARERFPAARLTAISDQETSDLEKAIRHALEAGSRRIRVAGALGGRIDHSLANVSLMVKYQPMADIALVGDGFLVMAVSQRAEIRGTPGDTLSLAAFCPARGVTVSGVQWPLCMETLEPGSRGVSNRFVAETARIEVEDGVLIVSHLFEPAG